MKNKRCVTASLEFLL